ncbi:MAG: SRPBCC family protein [Terracidiphilus sp.]
MNIWHPKNAGRINKPDKGAGRHAEQRMKSPLVALRPRIEIPIHPKSAVRRQNTMEPQFEISHWVPFPSDLVFAFFADPSNLPLLMPPRLEVRIEEADLKAPPVRPATSEVMRMLPINPAGARSEILVSFLPLSWLRMRVQWRVRITEFEWYSHFCDEQIEGPFERFHHRHEIRPEIRRGVWGTLVTDTIDFRLPFGPLGNLGSRFVRHDFAKSFAHRRRRLPEVMATAVRLADQCR